MLTEHDFTRLEFQTTHLMHCQCSLLIYQLQWWS